MSFRAYIQKRCITDTPAGDFTQDARDDSKMPDAKTWDELHGYLMMQGATHQAIEAARTLWAGYEENRRRSKR